MLTDDGSGGVCVLDSCRYTNLILFILVIEFNIDRLQLSNALKCHVHNKYMAKSFSKIIFNNTFYKMTELQIVC